jgi:two-component system sensor histidine kinase HydH
MNDQYTELAELAGGFVHEIKNHLGTLGLNLQLLAEDFKEPETQRERRALVRIEKLQAQCQQLTDVSNEFLRFARIGAVEAKPADLGKVIEELIDFVKPTASSARIDIQCYLPADLPPIPLETDLFKQALLNLMLNAEQAMPEGGQITLQAAEEWCECPSSENFDHAGRKSMIALHLIDTGNGMTPEVLAKLFRPFFSTKKSGNGLGLLITKRIVEAHGGSIEVQSEPGHGTKITLRLPTAPATTLVASEA